MAGPAFKPVAIATGFALGGSAIVILVGIFVIAMLIISLIPIYSSDMSVPGYGEIYNMSGLTIKAIYTNVSANFTGGSVLNLMDLSNICTAIFRAKNIQGFYACVATNFTAYGPSSNTDGTSALKRRELNDVSVYEIGDMLLLFSNTCSNKRALGRWYSTLSYQQNSSCVAQRAAACRAFIANPNTGTTSNQWSPFPVGFTQLIITNVTGCAAISIGSMSNVYYYNYASLYNRTNIGKSSLYAGDCQYSAIVSQSYLRGLVYNQVTTNSSVCSSVVG